MDRDFDRIVNSYADMLMRICMHYTKNASDAEDIVQATFLKLVEHNKNFTSYEHEKAWLIRVCTNLCKDSLKSSWNKKVYTGQQQEFTAPPYEISEQSPVLSCIRTLPPKQKTAVYLHYYEDMPVKEIATVMGANSNTVLSWLRRGRKSLEKLLKEENADV